MNRERGAKHRKDKNTGLYLPTREYWYDAIKVKEELAEENRYEPINMLEVEKFIDYLNIMECNVYTFIEIPSKKLALARKCTNKGINYDVVSSTLHRGDGPTEVMLENIYKQNDEYANVKVDGSIMTIIGLDGVYKYDIDLVNDTYKRYEVQSKRALKASIIDPYYREVVEANGDLKEFRGSLDILKIPDTAKCVLTKSITICNKNTGVVFGKNIEKCSTKCFSNNSSYDGLTFIEISTTKTVGLSILKSLWHSVTSYEIDKITIKYTRNISIDEYIYIIYKQWKHVNIESPNIEKMTDEFIMKVVQQIIKDKLDNLTLLKNRIIETKKMDILEDNFKILKKTWEKRLEQKASKELQISIGNMLKDIETRLPKLTSFLT